MQPRSPRPFRYLLAVLFMLVLFRPSAASGAESYYIEGSRVLLYKIINWWYDCLPEDSRMLCGLPVRCDTSGEAVIRYREADSQLTLGLARDLAGQLSLFAPCTGGPGPARLRCTWLNRAYFGRAAAAPVIQDGGSVTALVFHRVGRQYHRRLQAVENSIRIELTGRIGGLMDGKIALYTKGPFIKSCPGSLSGKDFPVSIAIFNGVTNEALARYTMVGE